MALGAMIFDVDGTLVDSVDLHAAAWQEALRDFGHEIAYDVIRHQIGKGGDQLLPAVLSKAEIKEHGEALSIVLIFGRESINFFLAIIQAAVVQFVEGPVGYPKEYKDRTFDEPELGNELKYVVP